MSLTEMAGKTVAELEEYTKAKAAAWMNSAIGSSNWAYINTYNSDINADWYRIILRVGFIDADRDGVFDVWEEFDYHWWYQTSTGNWADKLAHLPSEYRPGTDALNPANIEWLNGGLSYNSGGVFYQIRDMRNVAWS